ncbi:MAG TPA: hypothetical protein VFQ35_19945 [Polyangiaceae bacterium]|nr:hypothetical protein [Polyangiaceae bacterium]
MNDANREEAALVAHEEARLVAREEARLEARAEMRAERVGVRAEGGADDDGAFKRLYTDAFERHYVTELARLGQADP